MSAVVAYAPRHLDFGRPWLFELDLATGAVTAYLHAEDAGPLHARRDHAPRRRHASLASACNAYGLDVARDLEVRWWRECTLAQAAAMECRRLGVPAEVRADGAGTWILRDGRGTWLRGAYELRRWADAVALAPRIAA